MIYLDEYKLKADPICPDNEILKNAKRALWKEQKDLARDTK
jgi:hypothetical protein